ncbi:serine/threonine-protein kinase [Streptomyces sp. N1]|uniref:serine/threonine-protein kinase n=1 Tax=Streptomyces sp. N1 TaxID=576456 RepID=UPI0010111910|nr:serine/threonine-protein kinase [Streptomyces sp. N1]
MIWPGSADGEGATLRDQLLGSRYRLVRELGEGGMGAVWEAQDEKLDRRVAVKVISLLAGSGSRGDEARARFLREARITARLQHPHIVAIHDLGESGPDHGNAPFLVMELIRGEGLDAKLSRGDVSLEEAAWWGAQVCEALAEAHAEGVMHRDIKPSNIFITHTGTVKVLDFGVARAADPYATANRLTQTGFIVGTPPYMAPEQARGYPEPSSDLYALGCLLFELITGRLPFQAPDSVGYLTAHVSQEPPAPSSVRPGIPRAWDDLVGRLLRKDPSERYRTAADVSRDLRQLNQASPTHVLTRQARGSVPPSAGSTDEVLTASTSTAYAPNVSDGPTAQTAYWGRNAAATGFLLPGLGGIAFGSGMYINEGGCECAYAIGTAGSLASALLIGMAIMLYRWRDQAKPRFRDFATTFLCVFIPLSVTFAVWNAVLLR